MWDTLVTELFSSPIVTNASPTATSAVNGEVIAVSRRDHLCAALNARLGFSDVCGLDAVTRKQEQATVTQIASGLPSDGYGRGATAPVLPNEPTLFYRAGTENICSAVAAQVIDVKAASQVTGVKVWSSTAPEAAVVDFVNIVMGLVTSDPRSTSAITLLKQHYAAAVQQGATASDALKSTVHRGVPRPVFDLDRTLGEAVMLTRRQAILSTLFGTGYVGLRAIATGLPASFLLNPRRALAANPAPACDQTKAQYFVFNTCGSGDPINASVPGTYDDPMIVHSTDPTMAPTKLTLRGQTFTAAAPWAALPQTVLDRTTFWHTMTNTPVHPKEPDVLRLMGSTYNGEMLPSLLAKHMGPCLGTIQTQPIAVGATTPPEGQTYAGAALPIIPALALKATLTNPAGPLTNLQPLRDQTLNQLYDLYKTSANAAQKAYIDSLVTSQQQVRNINQNLLDALTSIKDNTADSQVLAAVTLIQMKVTPVISVHIPLRGRQPSRHRSRGRDGPDRRGRGEDRFAHVAARGGGARR